MPDNRISLKIIGRIHSPHKRAAGTPIQPHWTEAIEGHVEVFPEFADGLRDLDGFERIWLVYWFDVFEVSRIGWYKRPSSATITTADARFEKRKSPRRKYQR